MHADRVADNVKGDLIKNDFGFCSLLEFILSFHQFRLDRINSSVKRKVS